MYRLLLCALPMFLTVLPGQVLADATVNTRQCRGPKISHDESKIVFFAKGMHDDAGKDFLCVVDTMSRYGAPFDGNQPLDVTNPLDGIIDGEIPTIKEDSVVDWMNDGKTVIVSADNELWRVDVTGAKPPFKMKEAALPPEAKILWLQVIERGSDSNSVAVLLANDSWNIHVLSSATGKLKRSVPLPGVMLPGTTPAISHNAEAVAYVDMNGDVRIYNFRFKREKRVMNWGQNNFVPALANQPWKMHRHVTFRRNSDDLFMGESVIVEAWMAYHPDPQPYIPYVEGADGNHCLIEEYCEIKDVEDYTKRAYLRYDNAGDGGVGKYTRDRVCYSEPDCSYASSKVVCVRNGTLLAYNVPQDLYKRKVPNPDKGAVAEFLKIAIPNPQQRGPSATTPDMLRNYMSILSWFPLKRDPAEIVKDEDFYSLMKVDPAGNVYVYTWHPLFQEGNVYGVRAHPPQIIKVAAK